MSELDNGYINSNFEQEKEEKQDQISHSQIGTPIKLVEVKAPQMTAGITFPKPVTFSEPVTGTRNEDIFDKKANAVFPEDNEESYFINKSGVKDFSAMDEHADRWAAYRTASEPKKRNWVSICIAVAAVLGVVAGFGMMFMSLQSTEKDALSASATIEAPETIEETGIEEIESTETIESVEVPVAEETAEAESTVATEPSKESSFTREPLVMEDSTVKTFIEDSENIGYGVTYDAERAEQRLDALEELYEQMPERKE